MKKNEYYEEYFKILPKKDNGFIDRWALKAFRLELILKAEKIKYDCPESFDSSMIATFEDKSRLMLANPKQEAYMAFCKCLDEE